MKYRKFGKLDYMASALGFGCMRLPTNSKDTKDINEPESIRMIRRAIDGGVNYIDTAYPYHGGVSEILVGKALKDGYRERVKLATKLPVWLLKDASDFDKYLGEQLKKLDTGYIDLYLLHALDSERWDALLKMGVFDAMERYKKSGKVKAMGFSFHGDLKTFKTIIDAYDWAFCQIQFNLMDENYQAGLEGLRYAASKGIAVVIMEPLRGGALAKEPPEAIKAVWDRAPVSYTPAQWALRWVLNHPEVTVVLSGMSTMEQVEDNLKTADEMLPDSLAAEELKLTDEVKDMYKSRSKIRCTDCKYCMPCSFGVLIPENFAIYNEAFMYDIADEKRRSYYWMDEKNRATSCRQCGKCEKACPQSLPIRELLKQTAEFFA